MTTSKTPLTRNCASPPSFVPELADSHNELATLVLDIRDQLEKAGDEKAKNIILRRLRKALHGEANLTEGR